MECLSCEKKFAAPENYEKHKLSEEHKKMVSIKNSQNDSAVITSSDSKSVEAIKCQICNLSFTSLQSYQNHSETPEHAVKVMLQRANGNHESTKEESILPELNDKLSYPSYASCKVCSKIFSGPEPYKQHIESQAHKKKISVGENLTLKCNPCSKVFSGQAPYLEHMSSKVHKKKMLQIEVQEKYLSGMNSSSSQSGESGVLEEKEDVNKLWFCSICNKHCSGLIPYQQHTEGSTHFKNARRMKDQNNSIKMNSSMLPIMEVTNFIDGKLSEKSENKPQLMTGNYQIDDSESKNSVKNDNGVKEMIQVSDSNESKASKKFEIGNANYQGDSIKQNDFVYLEKMKELKIISTVGESIKIISPDEKIDFDELDQKEAISEKPDVVHLSENLNNELI